MNILIVMAGMLPALKYGGIERVVSSLGMALNDMGHNVHLLAAAGSHLPFVGGKVYPFDPTAPLAPQIPKGIDCIHLNCDPIGEVPLPYIITVHGNVPFGVTLDENSVFVSHNHATRHGSQSVVYNGLDWREYGDVDLKLERNYFHFLAKAAWRVKNVKGAIDIANARHEKLKVLGGYRINLKMGFRLTTSPQIHFKGMIGQKEKISLLPHSKGLIFPVKWHEPFGLAIIESLYFGCPIFGTPYGSLPEIVTQQYGFLSNSAGELADSMDNISRFDNRACHNYVKHEFDARTMANQYLNKYEMVIAGEKLNLVRPTLQQVTDKFLPFLP